MMQRRWFAWHLALTSEGFSSSATQPADDAQTLRQAQFDSWFAQYRLPLTDYLYGMTRDREWAADLVQETFLRAFAATSNPEAIQQPRAWLYRIATNTALTALRRQKRFAWLPLTLIEPSGSVDSSDRWVRPDIAAYVSTDMAADVAERDAVWQTLAELPPRWRSVLLLSATGGFETREIAAQLGLTEGNVRKILFRAKERFRTLHARFSQLDTETNDPPERPNGGHP